MTAQKLVSEYHSLVFESISFLMSLVLSKFEQSIVLKGNQPFQI